VLVPWRHTLIERRAAQIEDPVERLRYLRQEMSRPENVPISVFDEFKTLQFWKTRGSWVMLGLAAFSMSLMVWRPAHSTVKTASKLAVVRPALMASTLVPPASSALQSSSKVWLVDSRNGLELYSNGLRIDDKYAVPNQPRVKYPVYGYGKTDEGILEWKTDPAGIVYHTTESHLAPFEPGENRHLVRIGNAVLEYVQKNLSYHFVIDRFGRVFRVVNESDIANHAGSSIWGDERGAYVNLNASFLGIAFESATDDSAPNATPAQIHSARVLTEMLRSKYDIPMSDCVTHAQVSVNSSNMLIGYHTDWAGVFPFSEIGLPDNYATPPASVYAFGFNYDETYVKITGNRVWQGLLMADDQVKRQASSLSMPLSKYKATLQRRYREITAALKSKSPGKEKGDEI
jgi:hypothetical protein